MPSYIIKRAPDVDEYLYYSTVVDHPTSYVLTRAEMVEFVERETGHAAYTAERMARADENGTSAMWPRLGADAFGGWNDDGFIMRECDNLPPDAYLTREEMFEHMKQDAVLAGVSHNETPGGQA